jgi:hypothetical protein
MVRLKVNDEMRYTLELGERERDCGGAASLQVSRWGRISRVIVPRNIGCPSTAIERMSELLAAATTFYTAALYMCVVRERGTYYVQ